MNAYWAGIIGTVVGALIGFGGTWLSGWQQAKVAAREHRRAAYDQLLVALQRERQIIERTLPLWSTGLEPPPVFTDEEAALMQAKFAGSASMAVRVLFASWMRLRARFFGLARELAEARRGVDTGGPAPDQGQLEKARLELIGDAPGQALLGTIEAQVRQELGHDD